MKKMIEGIKLNLCPSCAAEHKPIKKDSFTSPICKKCLYVFRHPTFPNYYIRVCYCCSIELNICQICEKEIIDNKQITIDQLMTSST